MLNRAQLLEINPAFQKLFEINPQGKSFGSGNCLSCAAEAVNVLTHDINKPVTRIDFSNASYMESEVLADKQKNKFNNSDHFMRFIQASARGSVFVVDIEDHVYNVFKNFDGKILLIDTDLHMFKYINQAQDFKVPANMVLDNPDKCELLDPEKKLFDLFYDGEKGRVSVYTMGIAHPSWNNYKLETGISQSNDSLFHTAKHDEDRELAGNKSTQLKIGQRRH